MHTLRRVRVFAAVSAVSMFAWAMPAQASTVQAVECVVSGAADAAVDLLGGTGTYGFTEFTAGCLAKKAATKGTKPSTGGLLPGGFAVATLDITSNGTFTNTVCGTGEAVDSDPSVSANVTSTDAAMAASFKDVIEGSDLSYSINFVGGQGVLQFTNAGTGTDVIGGGYINISPDGDLVSPPQCVDGFNVVGELTAIATDKL